MLKLWCFIVSALILNVVQSAPVKEEVVKILSQESFVEPEGKFKWSFESDDGTKHEQTGEIKVIDKETTAEEIHGSYSYVDPEGKTHSIEYVANEQGFIPKGSDISPEIVSHLEHIVANPAPILTEKLHTK